MSIPHDDKDRLYALLDSISDDLSELPDENIHRVIGTNPVSEIEQASKTIKALLGPRRASLYEASAKALRELKGVKVRQIIPDTPAERRALFKAILNGNHPWSDEATLAFRGAGELSDDDIVGILEDLAELKSSGDQ